MNNIKFTKKNVIIWCILFVVGIIILCWSLNRTETKIKEIFENCEYTIGIVTIFHKATPKIGQFTDGTPRYIEYSFLINGVEMTHMDQSNYNQNDEVRVGDKYIVIYSKNNPKNSIILVDYPIFSTSDFEKYIEEFKINPPKYVSRKDRQLKNK